MGPYLPGQTWDQVIEAALAERQEGAIPFTSPQSLRQNMQGNGRFAAAILSPKQRLHIEVACYDRAKPRDEWVSTELKDLTASVTLPASSKPA